MIGATSRQHLLIFSGISFVSALAVAILIVALSIPGLTISLAVMNAVFVLVFIPLFLHILSRDLIFAAFYGLLFVYTIFAQLAYLYDPVALAAQFAGIYFTPNDYLKYLLFVSLSFLTLYFSFLLFYNNKSTTNWIEVHYNPKQRREIDWFSLAIIAHTLIVLAMFVLTYSSLSYENQAVLKGNKLFFYSYTVHPVVILAAYMKFRRFTVSTGDKLKHAILFLASTSLFLAVSIRTGIRYSLFSLLIGFVAYHLSIQGRSLNIRFKQLFKYIPIAILFLLATNILRQFRGSSGISLTLFLNTLVLDPDTYLLSFLDLQTVLYQDYTVPALVLMQSIADNFVIPSQAIKSILINSIPGPIDYPSIGSAFSRVIDPDGRKGYGYYFFAEGFHMMGWFGILYNALIPIIGLRLWKLFMSTKDEELQNYIQAVIIMSLIQVVRGQSSSYVKYVFYIFIPAAVLFCLAARAKLRVHLSQRATVAKQGSNLEAAL